MMNLTSVRFALVAFFVATTGCAATAEDASDDVVVSVDTNAQTQTREHILLARQVGVSTEATTTTTTTDLDSARCPGPLKCNEDGICRCAD